MVAKANTNLGSNQRPRRSHGLQSGQDKRKPAAVTNYQALQVKAESAQILPVLSWIEGKQNTNMVAARNSRQGNSSQVHGAVPHGTCSGGCYFCQKAARGPLVPRQQLCPGGAASRQLQGRAAQLEGQAGRQAHWLEFGEGFAPVWSQGGKTEQGKHRWGVFKGKTA